MDVTVRESLENILLAFTDVFTGQKKPSENEVDSAIQDALDAMEALFRAGPISADWLTTEYEVLRDSNPGLTTEDLMRILTSAVNEKMREGAGWL
jgi:hypothetical protein